MAPSPAVLVAAAGNEHVNLALPTRSGGISPKYPAGLNQAWVLTNECQILPGEGPNVIQVSSVGPSTTEADYSNYGYPNIENSAPGGFYRDLIGPDQYARSANMILSTYPLHVAIADVWPTRTIIR